ncbi:MAG: hypothetical protein WC455_17685 [Dehalococcoidia bacterium]|jgi:hypothetical protein
MMEKLSLSLQCKLGSLIIHAKEAFSDKRHPYDKLEFDRLLQDSEVKEWMNDLDKDGLLPKER